jgi:hypothetical protein
MKGIIYTYNRQAISDHKDPLIQLSEAKVAAWFI